MELPLFYQEQADAYTHIIRDQRNRHIVQFSQDHTGEAEAKARHFVLCVNAHEGLVEALEQIRKFSHGGAVSMSVDAGEFHEIELLAEAALAQAKGGE
jgi:predicted 3-demethylubiquinone-9 3-methyltransferase (glyoxalase superfamily)